MTDPKMDLTQLAAHFPVEAIEWRLAQSGKKRDGEVWAKCLAYLTNRAIMDRLDTVLGPANWRNEYHLMGAGIMCGLSVKVGDEWITKWDGAEPTDIESYKGGLSSAMKRCAVQWGIGRYLYDLPQGRPEISPQGRNYVKAKGDVPAFKWDPPKLPKWALPGPEKNAQPGPTKTPPAKRKAKAAAERLEERLTEPELPEPELPDGAAGVKDGTPDPNAPGPPLDFDPEMADPPADVSTGQYELIERYEPMLKAGAQRSWFERQRTMVTDYDAADALLRVLKDKLGEPPA